MVLLTMTPSIVEALQTLNREAHSEKEGLLPVPKGDEPSLDDAAVGNPVSHSQIIDIRTALRDAGNREHTLESLLKGSRVYVPPPPPKPEKSNEYKALMARLRRDQEQLEYERMTNPPAPMETFSQRFPNGASMARGFAAVNRPMRHEDIGDDDVTYNDVHRQLMLMLNFLVSILGVAATLWILARWWSTPARLFLTLGGSVVVGIAEVAVYSGYIWHLGEADKKDKKTKEVKEVMHTWTVGADEEPVEPVTVGGKSSTEDENLRRRKKEST